MSTGPLPFNPYLSPGEIRAEPVRSGRPGLLVTLCVLAIILGSIGLLTGVAQAVGLFAGKRIQQAMQPPRPGGNEELARIQKDMQDQIYAIEEQYFLPKTILVVVHFIVAGMLLLGGILAVSRLSIGRTILIGVCVLAMGYEVGRSAVQAIAAMKTMPIMETFMEQTIAASPQGPNRQAQEAANQGVKIGMKVGLVLGFVFAGAFAAVKLAYYITTLVYMSRQKTKALFNDHTGTGQAPPGKL